jgi:hypothetical protein
MMQVKEEQKQHEREEQERVSTHISRIDGRTLALWT